MISVQGKPVIIQEWPILGYHGSIPIRSKKLNLKIQMEVSYNSADSETVNKFLKAYQELMASAIFEETGNPVVLKKVAKMDAADGSFSMVQPADSVPVGMLKGVEDNGNEQRHQDETPGRPKEVWDATREDVRETKEEGRTEDETGDS